MKFNRRGFTLIELIIVIVIIGILASIAAPMMQGVRIKAICAEAVTGMSTLREVLRQYYVQYGGVSAYVNDFPGANDVDSIFSAVNFNADSLNGTYFTKDAYRVRADIGAFNSRIRCYPALSTSAAPKYLEGHDVADDAQGYLDMDTNGKISAYHISRSGYTPRPA